MRKLLTISFLMAALIAMVAVSVSAGGTEVKHDYVGVKKCKTCHKPQFKSWSETGHAKAFDLLSDEEKKNEKCVACHSTGTTAKGVFLEGVQCESCHGAGSDYKSAKIMSKKKWKADPDAHKKMALDAGLNYPKEADCVRCHTKEGNSNFKEFKFEDRKDKVHPVVAKK